MKYNMYRAKRLDNKEWTYGYLFCIWERAYILWGMTNDVPNMIEVDLNTVCRQTNIIDDNGKTIYEGDVVKTNNGRICQVVWFSSTYHQGFDLNALEYEHPAPKGCIWSDIEVVGDIFDEEWNWCRK